jgi:hypothetical protein
LFWETKVSREGDYEQLFAEYDNDACVSARDNATFQLARFNAVQTGKANAKNRFPAGRCARSRLLEAIMIAKIAGISDKIPRHDGELLKTRAMTSRSLISEKLFREVIRSK